MTTVNSTTVLQLLEDLARSHGNETIEIHRLASLLEINITALVSILTELEHRDKIILNLSASSDVLSEYNGMVKLMDAPLKNPEESF